MEHALRCNHLRCRLTLVDQAVVTTCSHVFCRPCSDSLGLSTTNPNERLCPACNVALPNPDDAVIANLNPSEEYKTSVLSGLTPSIIVECAGRAFAFHAYQTNQEIKYQECMVQSLQTKYSQLSTEMDKIIVQANSQIEKMRDEYENLDLRYNDLAGKNEKLQAGLRERSKKYIALEKNYKAIKDGQMQPGMELAADEDAGSLLRNAGQYEPSNLRNGPVMHSRVGSNGSGGRDGRRSLGGGWEQYGPNQRSGLQSARSAPMQMTPSGHRHPFAQQQLYGNVNTGRPNANYQPTPHRPILQNLDPNMLGNGATPRYGGMSAGVKVGRPQNNQGYQQYGSFGTGRPSGLHQRG